MQKLVPKLVLDGTATSYWLRPWETFKLITAGPWPGTKPSPITPLLLQFSGLGFKLFIGEICGEYRDKLSARQRKEISEGLWFGWLSQSVGNILMKLTLRSRLLSSPVTINQFPTVLAWNRDVPLCFSWNRFSAHFLHLQPKFAGYLGPSLVWRPRKSFKQCSPIIKGHSKHSLQITPHSPQFKYNN